MRSSLGWISIEDVLFLLVIAPDTNLPADFMLKLPFFMSLGLPYSYKIDGGERNVSFVEGNRIRK